MRLSLLRDLERFLLPNACVACEQAVEPQRPDALLCGPCRARLRRLAWGCDRCRQPLPPVGPCRFCAGWPPALCWVESAVWLDGRARDIVHHLKYEGYRALAVELADVVVRIVPRPSAEALVPLPLTARRERTRGYNQAAALAHALAPHWAIPVNAGLLRRTRDTRSQTALTPEERERNMRGAFAAVGVRTLGASPPCPSPPSRSSGERVAVILIDDVLTTGATVAEAARALAAAGWGRIGAVTFARAEPYARAIVAT